MKRYLLLNALTPEAFGLSSFAEIEEALEEFACKMLYSLDTEGQPIVFAWADTKDILENMVTTVDLDGTMIEYTAIYDQLVRIG